MPLGKRQESDIFFLAFTLSAAIFLIPIGIVLQSVQLQTSSWTAYIGAILSIACIGLWRKTRYRTLALLIYELNLLSIILINAYLLGGVTSPVMLWLGIVPILPLFIADLRWSYLFLGLSFFSILIFYEFDIGKYNLKLIPEEIEKLFAAIMFGTFILTQMVLISTVYGITANRLRRIANDNKRLEILTQKLRLIDGHKDKFLSNISHEMRTPLNVIHGYLDLLLSRQDISTEIRQQLEQATSASTHMVSLVNDLLDYSQIHQGQFTLAIQPVQLPFLIENIFNTFKLQAHNKNLEYTYDTNNDLPQWVLTDPTRLSQIILNLLSNAIKFTSNGKISLTVYYTTEADSHTGMLNMVVSDTGVGLPEAVQEQICTPFYQYQPVQFTQKNNGLRGSGLGLAITYGLIKIWNGKISIQSDKGIGSTFLVSLPTIRIPGTQIEPIKSDTDQIIFKSNISLQRILIVDDHAMNRMVAIATIRKHLPNFHIDQAENGQQALRKMASEIYDIVLLDIVMPDLSGIEVLRTVRETYPAPFCHVHAIAFTANVEANIKMECEKTGFNGFISKPFNALTLIQTLNQINQK